MLKMIKGCKIHSVDMLNEGYKAEEFALIANVNADKILVVSRIMRKLVCSL